MREYVAVGLFTFLPNSAIRNSWRFDLLYNDTILAQYSHLSDKLDVITGAAGGNNHQGEACYNARYRGECMIIYVQRCIVYIMLFALAISACMASDLSLDRELVHTPEGNFYMWHRSPAQEADLGMPFLQGGETKESLVYRVRDRKLRDQLFFVRVHQVTTQSVDQVQQFYAGVLGNDAVQTSDPKTGEISISAGTRDHFRLVVITPKEQGCDVRLEHIQQFTVPERVFTEAEQRAIHVLNAISERYKTSQRVTYVMEQRAILTGAQTPPPLLTWNIDFTRPKQVLITAETGKITGIRITTENDNLRVHPQVGNDELRPLTGELTIDNVPELQDDPVANLMLGKSLITDQLDFISIDAVPGVPTYVQALIVLTYPDTNETLRLTVNLQRKTILRCETVITNGTERVTMVRVYKHLVLDSPVNEQQATLPQQTSKTSSRAVVSSL